jgi:hypothetical protein
MVSPIAPLKNERMERRWLAKRANDMTTIHPVGTGGYSPDTFRV